MKSAPAIIATTLARALTTPGSFELFHSILESMGDGIVVADEEGRFLLFNPAAERILGIGFTDVVPDRLYPSKERQKLRGTNRPADDAEKNLRFQRDSIGRRHADRHALRKSGPRGGVRGRLAGGQS